MGLHTRARHSFLGLIAGFFLVVLVASVQAQTVTPARPTVQVTATGARYIAARNVAYGTTEYVLEGSFAHRFGTSSVWDTVKHGVRQSPISSGTLGSLAKRGLKGGVVGVGASIALEGIIDGAGWAIDELQKEVIQPGSSGEELTGPWEWCYASPAGPRCGSPAGICSYLSTVATNGACVGSFEHSDGSLRLYTQADYDYGPNVYSSWVATKTYGEVWNPAWAVGQTPDLPVTDLQLGDAIKDRPDIVNGLLRDPRTGAVIMTPEMTDMLNEYRRELEQKYGADASPDVVPVTGDQPNPDQETPWPGFCSWATVVCDFIDWFKTDGGEDMPLPERELELSPSTWTSGIGQGACPVSESVTVEFAGTQGHVEFDWQPLCSGVTTLRPFLLTVSVVVAALIVAGVRKSAV